MAGKELTFCLTLACLLSAAAGLTHAGDKTSGWTVSALPDTDLYPRYIADPKRTVFGVRPMYVPDSEIEATGSIRFGLNLGARIALFRLHPRTDPDRGLQADLEVGFMGQSDWENSTGNIGWDGSYALVLSYKSNETVQFRFGAHHLSAHLGDEYAERTGRQRLDYLREEFLAGVVVAVGERIDAYIEAGYSYSWHSDLQERGRAQAGIQHEAPPTIWKERLGWYAALDLSAYAERGWALNASSQVGFVLPDGDKKWRIGLELYDGRSHLGEFFLEDETYVSAGVWLDL